MSPNILVHVCPSDAIVYIYIRSVIQVQTSLAFRVILSAVVVKAVRHLMTQHHADASVVAGLAVVRIKEG